MEPKVIVPTIGRRLWYFPSDYELGLAETKPETVIQADKTQPCDAGVCYVHSDRLVNLIVTDHKGHTHRKTSVRLVQPGDDAVTVGGYATWMPFQVAAK